MIPVLFNKEETTFTSLGLGEIDATVVEVERERNGIYSLYMELPFSSDYVALIEQEMQIKADAGARTKWQTFKVNRVVKDSDKKIVKVYADHISMDTINDAMKPKVVIRQQTAEGALRQWNANRISAKQYDVLSDITTISGTTWTIDEVENARQALGGVEGSILDVWGGEFEFDNNRIILHKEMGREAPTVLEYGRNIVSLEYEELIDGVYTSIYPYASYTPRSEDNRQQEPVMVTLDELIVDGDYVGNYQNRRVQIVDFSSDFDSSGDNPEIPTQTKLRSLAKSYVKTNEVGAPKITQEVDFVDLSKTLDYADMQVMEEIELNDRVPIFYPNIKITSGVKVTKTIWQPLINQYKKITVSTIGALKTSSLNSDLKTSIKNLEKQQKQINNTVPYLINAQGNRIWYTTPDDTLEHKIGDTWFKKNGKYTIMYQWNGSMWEEIINNETFSKELEAQFAEIEKQTQEMTASIAEANTKAENALEKVGVNTNLLDEHKKTLDEINGTLIPSLSESIGGVYTHIDSQISDVLTTVSETNANTLKEVGTVRDLAGNALAEASKTDSKIADYVSRTGLISGSSVDTKINEATGAWSQELSRVESEIDNLSVGGRNYLLNSGEPLTPRGTGRGGLELSTTSEGYLELVAEPVNGNYFYFTQLFESRINGQIANHFKEGDYLTFSIDIKSPNSTDIPTLYVYGANNYYQELVGTLGEEFSRFHLTVQYKSSPIPVNLAMGIQNKSGTFYFTRPKIEKGSIPTDWTPALEDNYTQQDFKIFNAQYSKDVEGINSKLSTVENKTDANNQAFTTFKENEYKRTAERVSDTFTKSETTSLLEDKADSSQLSQYLAKSTYERDAEQSKERFETIESTKASTSYVDSEITKTADAIKLSLNDYAKSTDLDGLASESYASTQAKIEAGLVERQLTNYELKTGVDSKVATMATSLRTETAEAMKTVYTKSETNSLVNGKADSSALSGYVKTATYEQGIDGVKQSIGAVQNDVDKKATITSLNDVKQTVDGNVTSITKMQTSLDGKATQADIDASILADKTVKDTRTTDQLPSYYQANYPRQEVKEFKTNSVIGIDEAGFSLVTTEVPWTGSSGGTIKQTARTNNDMYIRRGHADQTQWTDWEKVADTTYVNTKITEEAGLIRTELSEYAKKVDLNGYATTQKVNTLEQSVTGNTNTIAQVKSTADGAVQKTSTEYQTILERSNLYARTIGSTDEEINTKVARMVMTDSVFQTEIATAKSSGLNLIDRTTESQGYMSGVTGNGVLTGDLAERSRYVRITGIVGGQVYTLAKQSDMASDADQFRLSWRGSDGYTVISSLSVVGDISTVTAPTNSKELVISYPRDSEVKMEIGSTFTGFALTPDLASQITQTANSWAVQLKDGNDLKTAINASTDGLRFAGHLIYLDGDTYMHSAFADKIKAIEITADKIIGGTADFAKIRAVNLDLNTLSGNRADLISAGLKSSSGGSLELNGDLILSTASDNSQVYIGQGILGIRNPSGATIGQFGYQDTGGSPVTTIQNSWGTHFRIMMRRDPNHPTVTNKEALRIISGGTEMYLQTDDVYLEPANRVHINSPMTLRNEMRMQGDSIVNPYGMYLMYGGSLYTISAGNSTRLEGSGTLSFRVNSSEKMKFDTTHNYSFQTLNMQNNAITQQSDERLKKNIKDLADDDLSKIRQIRMVSYEWKDESKRGTHKGVIAQEFAKVYPELVDEVDGLLSINSTELEMAKLHAIQQLDEQTRSEIDDLKAEIDILKQQIDLLKGA